MLLNVLGHCGTGSEEMETAAELLGQKGVVQRSRQRNDLLQKRFHFRWPDSLVIAARVLRNQQFSVGQPGRAQAVKVRTSDLQALTRRVQVHFAAIEKG